MRYISIVITLLAIFVHHQLVNQVFAVGNKTKTNIERTIPITIKNSTDKVEEVTVESVEIDYKATVIINPGSSVVVDALYVQKDRDVMYRIKTLKGDLTWYIVGGPESYFTATLFDDGWVISDTKEFMRLEFSKYVSKDDDKDINVTVTLPDGSTGGSFNLPRGIFSHSCDLPYIESKRRYSRALSEYQITVKNEKEGINTKKSFGAEINHHRIDAAFTYNKIHYPRGSVKIN